MLAIHAQGSGSISHKISTERFITYIAGSINKAHMATRTVTALLLPIHTRLIFLDTQEGTESVIGSKFSDLASIIAQVEDKKRVGVCLDTCKPIYFVSHFDEMN